MMKKRFHTDKMIEPEALANEFKSMFSESSIMEEQMGDTTAFAIEKYFFRNNSYASCTMCMNKNDTGTDLVIFCNGAASGLLNIDLGAAEDFMNKVEKAIQKYL